MRRSTICAGLAIALAVGCIERPSFAQDMPPQPEPVAQNCTADRSVEYPAYARTIEILQRSGELERAAEHFGTLRTAVDNALAARNPAAQAEVKPVLDRLFSGKEVRKRAACDFTRHSRNAQIVDAWDAWISDKTMRNIHALIVADPISAAAGPVRMSASRREALKRVWIATGRTRFAADRRQAMENSQKVVETALDPASSARFPMVIAPPIDEQVAIDRWLAVQLKTISDGDLDGYLGFAESEPGQAFYRSLRATYTSAMGEWDGWLAVETRTRIAPSVIVLGPEAIASQLAQARISLDAIPNQGALSGIKSRLDNLAFLAPENADVKILQARVELDMLATLDQLRSPYEKKQIRAADSKPDTLRMWASDRPEPYLALAIKLAPRSAEARAFLGRVRFLQRKDADATALFAEARRLDPDEPNVPFFEADMAYANGDYAKAERAYRTALARPNGRAIYRIQASARLREALIALGREREYRAIIREQVRSHPDLWDLRFHSIDDLLDHGGSSAEALAMLEPIPKAWGHDRRHEVLTRIQIQKVIEAAPSIRMTIIDAWELTYFDFGAIGKALCRAKDMEVADVIFESPARPGQGLQIARSMLGCGVLERRPDVIAAALPFLNDIDEPVNDLWQDTALCGAAALGDAKVFTLLLKAKADPERRCSGGATVHQRLIDLTAAGNAGAGAAWVELQKYRAFK